MLLPPTVSGRTKNLPLPPGSHLLSPICNQICSWCHFFSFFSCSQQTWVLQHHEENWSRWVESVVQWNKILHVNEQKDSCVMIFSGGEWRFRGWLISFNSSSCHLFTIPWRCWKAVFHSYSLASLLPSCMPAGGTGRNVPKLIKVLHMYVTASPLHKQTWLHVSGL